MINQRFLIVDTPYIYSKLTFLILYWFRLCCVNPAHNLMSGLYMIPFNVIIQFKCEGNIQSIAYHEETEKCQSYGSTVSLN